MFALPGLGLVIDEDGDVLADRRVQTRVNEGGVAVGVVRCGDEGTAARPYKLSIDAPAAIEVFVLPA